LFRRRRMFKKDAQVRRIFSVLLLVFAGVTVFLLTRVSDPKNETQALAKSATAVVKENPSVAASDVSAAVVSADAPRAVAVSRPLYRFETGITPGQPATIAPRFATPSAAEKTVRSARLAELVEGGLAALREGDVVHLPLMDNRTAYGRIVLVQREADGQILVGGQLTGGMKGSFSLGEDESRFGGTILPADGAMGYVIETGTDGAAYLLEKNKNAIVCMELPVIVVSRSVVRESKRAANAAGALVAESAVMGEGTSEATSPEYLLSSRPTAPTVAYLDFDGETVTDVNWNGGSTINATSSGLSAAQITEVWRRVAEDFRAFNIDVTTDRSRYDNTPVRSRIRCIITQNSGWYGSAGGVAYIGSWSGAGTSGLTNTIPCWVFANMLATNPRYIAEATSHEIGHTLGLSHDGLNSGSGTFLQGYYSGHGSGATSWAPIMGSGYYNNVVQWSDGSYSTNGNVGNNTENDLAIISDASNRAGYMSDDANSARASASPLGVSGSTVSTVGLIERTGDVDMYSFTTGSGAVSFTLIPEFSSMTNQPNLDARATLYDASGNVVADSNPTGSLFPSISTTVGAGTYYLAISGVGEGSVPGTGYTNYASLGRYEITGTVVATSGLPPAISSVSSASTVAGSAFSHQIVASNSPTSYGASGLPAGLGLNTSSGLISGAVTSSAGVYNVTLSAANGSGSGTQAFALTVTNPLPAAPSITSASSGSAVIGSAFSHQVVATNSPTSYAASGLPGGLGMNSASGLISGTVSSSATPGLYSATIVATNAGGSGTQTFSLTLTSPLPAAPVISSSGNANATIGSAFSYQITASNSPTSYGASGLPSGLSLNTSSGLISGTPSAGVSTGIHNVTLGATNAGGTGTKILAINVSAPAIPAPVITSVSSARVVMGIGFALQVTATNSPTSYSASGLPSNLSINSSTGLISGTVPTSVSAGSYVATITATNAGGSGTQQLTLDVKSSYAAWAQDKQIGDINAVSAADPDGDGLGNLIEYAFDRSPSTADITPVTQVSVVNDNGTRRLEITFVRPNDRPDLVYTVEVSADMQNWSAGHAYGLSISNGSGLPTQEIERTSLGSSGERLRVRDIGGTGKRFIRVKVTTL
jgi:hypothetical protein